MAEDKIELIATFPIYKPFRRLNENFRKSLQKTLKSINRSEFSMGYRALLLLKMRRQRIVPVVEELNQFLFSSVSTTRKDLQGIPARILIEDKIDHVYSKFRKRTLKQLKRIYSKDPELKNSRFAINKANKDLRLGLEEEITKIQKLPDIIVKKIEKIYLNGSLIIWDMPGAQIDRIIAGYEKINREGDSLDELDIGIVADELALATFGKEHVPVLQAQITMISELIQVVTSETKKYTVSMSTLPSEEARRLISDIGSVFLGKLLGSREPLFLAEKQLKRYIALEQEIKDEADKIGSDFLSKIYDNFLNKHTIIDLCDQLETIQEIISTNVEPLRKLLKTIESARIDTSSSKDSISEFVKFVTGIYFNLEEFRFITETFQDIPSFTAMGGGIALESVGIIDYSIPENTDIFVKDVFRTFPLINSTVYALRGVDLEIKKGEFVAIMGPSGSGKTTLLNVLSGLDKPDRGVVNVAGLDLVNAGERQLTNFRKNNVSFIYQSYNLLPILTNEENVRLPADLGSDKNLGNKKERSKLLLAKVGLEQFVKGKPLLLSGGQQQRVTIARALMNKPDIIFADEPTGDLDGVTGGKVMDLLGQFHKEGVTIVMVTHDAVIAQRADRIINMFDGKNIPD